jgi:hypothetical protein
MSVYRVMILLLTVEGVRRDKELYERKVVRFTSAKPSKQVKYNNTLLLAALGK